MKILILCLSLFLLLTGCMRTATFSPNTLPDACLHRPYEAKIVIDGGTVVSNSLQKYGTVSDENFRLTPRMYFNESRDINGNLVPKYDGNELTLSGTPTSLKPIDVNIGIGFYKHMFEFQDLWFEKQYQLIVKNCDQINASL